MPLIGQGRRQGRHLESYQSSNFSISDQNDVWFIGLDLSKPNAFLGFLYRGSPMSQMPISRMGIVAYLCCVYFPMSHVEF